jgi:hypothetical protein
MKDQTSRISFSRELVAALCVSLLLTVLTPALFAEEPLQLYEPPRLFIIPVAYTLKAFDINASGGTTWETGQVSFSGTGFLGLGNIAQIEISSLRTFSVQDGDFETLTNIPAAGIKLALPLEERSRILPSIAVSYRRSFDNTVERGPRSFDPPDEPDDQPAHNEQASRLIMESANDVRPYKRQFADLYILASKSFFSSGEQWRGFRLHAGVDYFGTRLELDSTEQTKSFWRPFGGIEIWASRHAKLMAEVEWFPKIHLNGEPTIDDDPLWMTVVGVRIFITRFLTADVGVRYQQDFETIADAKLEGKISLGIPTHLLFARKSD